MPVKPAVPYDGHQEERPLKGLHRQAHKVRNWLSNTKYFKKVVREVFNTVDIDNSNDLDPAEIYCAILLFYTKVIPYVSTATPPSRSFVLHLVKELDIDASGSINLDEFESLAVVLSEHLASRIATEAVFTFFIAPVLSILIFHYLDSYFSQPKWVPSYIIYLGLSFRNTLVVLATILFIVPRFSKMYERITDKEIKVCREVYIEKKADANSIDKDQNVIAKDESKKVQ